MMAMKSTNFCPMMQLGHFDIDFGTFLPSELGITYTAGASRQATQL